MADRSATQQPVLSKAGKDFKSAAKGKECFLKEVRKDKSDGVSLSG